MRKFHIVAGLTKYREKEKNSRAREIRGEYLRRVRCGFRQLTDGNHHAFSIDGFVAFILVRRHKLASRRARDAPLSLFARERRYFQRAQRRDACRRRGANGPLSALFTDVHRE